MRNKNIMVSLIFIRTGIFFLLSPKLFVTPKSHFHPPSCQVVMTMSSVSAVMEACGAGSLEMILGWSMLSGFPGK